MRMGPVYPALPAARSMSGPPAPTHGPPWQWAAHPRPPHARVQRPRALLQARAAHGPPGAFMGGPMGGARRPPPCFPRACHRRPASLAGPRQATQAAPLRLTASPGATPAAAATPAP